VRQTSVKIGMTFLSREWLVALALAIGLTILTGIPYALGYVFARPGTQFTGVLMSPDDANSYLAKMQQGYMGAWLYTIPFTSEPHAAEFVGGFYLLLGHLARLFNLSVLQMWHLARCASALVLFLVTFAFIRAFIEDAYTRRIAYLLALTGSGLGWLLVLSGQMHLFSTSPVDFEMPESHPFFSALTFPHFAVGTALILISVWWSIRTLDMERLGLAVATGVVNLALAIVYPFLIYLSAAVVALNWLNLSLASRRLRLRAGFLAGITLLVPAPLLLYYWLVLRTNPVFRAWDAQAITPSPHPFHYVIAYGVMLALAAPALRQREFRGLWLWVLAVAFLIYAPLNPQRRFVEGVQVPLAVLAARGLTSYYLPKLRATPLFQKMSTRPNYSPDGLERLILAGLLCFFALSNLYLLANTAKATVVEQPHPNFLPAAEVHAVDWAGANLPRGAIILASYEIGSFIPTRTELRTVIGHWAETMDFWRKYGEVGKFYGSDAIDEWRQELLRTEHVDYVFYGPLERTLGTYDMASMPGLDCVYSDSGVAIYRVVDR
jgi:hypothetical protein